MIHAHRTRSLVLVGTFAALGILHASGASGGPQGKDKPDKVEIADLGKPAPAFELSSLDGKPVKLADFKGKTVVLQWLNPACPFCKFAYGEEGPMRTVVEQLRGKGVIWLSIVSEKPDNSGGKIDVIRKFVAENQVKTPVLLDPEGKVGKLYAAKATPHVFLISEKGALVYRGAIDNAPLGKVEKSDARANYVVMAIADLSSGHAVTKAETKPYGTPIQYARP